tara:strand:+ start:856 stop:1170 length:315 start_codon:yes stop_codon:yes gene_type:complete
MEKNENWAEISQEFKDISKKIKNHIDQEILVDDLKNTFKSTIDNTSQLINNILNTVESTINDEDIKKETKEVVTKINDEFKLIINDAKENFSEIFVNDSTIEEE